MDITTQAAILNRGAPDDGGYYAYILVIDYKYPFECFVQRISIIGSITDALHNLKTILAIGKKGDDPKFHCNVCFQMKAFLEHEFRTNLKTDFEKKIENLSWTLFSKRPYNRTNERTENKPTDDWCLNPISKV